MVLFEEWVGLGDLNVRFYKLFNQMKTMNKYDFYVKNKGNAV